MFDIEGGWKKRFTGAALPAATKRKGWLIAHDDEPAFVEPILRVVQGDPETARVIVVAAPGAVGKSTYARKLSASAAAILVDLASTESLGGNFFTGGIANAFGYNALADAAEGRLALIVDALDEAQLRSGAQGFADGLSDLARIVEQPKALPAALFGRAAAAEEAWLILEGEGISTCLLEIEYFDNERAVEYIARKLDALAGRQETVKRAYQRHATAFRELAVATRDKLIATRDGGEARFAGYAPVLDAVCSFAVEDGSLNPQARAVELSAQGPVALVDAIAFAILQREQSKLIEQMRAEVPDLDPEIVGQLYTPAEQLGLLMSRLADISQPGSPRLGAPELQRTYEQMVAAFAPQHPFLDGRGKPSNAAFAAYVLVWAITSGHAPDAARRAVTSRSELSSGLFFDLYMHWLSDNSGGEKQANQLDLADIGPLYATFAAQAVQNEHPSLEISGEADEESLSVHFEMITATADEPLRSYGPFQANPSAVLEFRGPLTNVRVAGPVAVSLGDGQAVHLTAPVEFDVDTLELNGRELRILKPLGVTGDDLQQVTLIAPDADIGRVERITLLGGKLAASMPGVQAHPWTNYAAVPSPAPNEAIDVLRRRARRVLTAFRSHSKGALVRLAAKINHARMMKRDDLGPKLVARLVEDGILSTFDAGKFYVLHPDRLALKLNMDYQAIQQQRWTPEADAYLSAIVE